MIKTFKYKTYNKNKLKQLHMLIEMHSEVWNHCIALSRRYYRRYNKSINKFQLMKHMVKLKHRTKQRWKVLPSQSIQDVVERMDKSYKNFYRNLKQKKRASIPSFKKRTMYKSFTLKQCGYKILENNTIKIHGDNYRFYYHRPIEGKIKTVTIKRDNAGRIYLYFTCEGDYQIQIPKTGNAVGIDFGMKNFLTLSTDKIINNPLFYYDMEYKISKLNQILSRKKKGANNRKSVKQTLSNIHQKLTNKRNDFQYKLALDLVREFDKICIEDLDIKSMQEYGSWGKKIADLSYSNFVDILEWLSIKYSKKLIKIDRYFPSSKLCNVCNTKNNELLLKDREWTCKSCNTKHDRDINASLNILNNGLGWITKITSKEALFN